MYGGAAVIIVVSAVVLRPPVEPQTSHQPVTATIATVTVLAVALAGAYALARLRERKHWRVWAGLALASLVTLGASLLMYQAQRSVYSVEFEGTEVIVGTEGDLTELGKQFRATFPTTSTQEFVGKTAGKPQLVWESDALERHARRLERYYYGCEALIALSAIALIGAWRARAPVHSVVPAAVADTHLRAPAVNVAGRRFRVAVSFPGDVRERAEGIAAMLARTLGRDAVFYDRWYRAELARPNLDLYLQTIYKTESDLLVILLCAEYERKEWCGLEWRVVRDLIKGRESERIMLLRLDEAPVAGLLSIDGYLDIVTLSDEEVAEAILTRVSNAGAPTSPANHFARLNVNPNDRSMGLKNLP
jgi:TIR domain